jgi:hypothetical protein
MGKGLCAGHDLGEGAIQLADSHLLAETAERTGVEQLGSYYGSNTYVRDWIGDGNSLFGLSSSTTGFRDQVVARMDRANATHLLLVEPRTAETFLADDRFVSRHAIGRYQLFERRNAVSRWAAVLDGPGAVSVDRVAPGRMRLHWEGAPDRVVVKESFHPFWRTEPPGLARLTGDANGMMVVDGFVADGATSLDLVYAPPALPWRVTLAGGCGIALLWGVDALLRRRSSSGDAEPKRT